MKKCLILVVSSQYEPYDKLWLSQKNTWDSIEIDGVETVFYFSAPVKPNTDKEIYFPLAECYETMSAKMILAFEWALKNKEFDYISRVNSSCFVDKKRLIEYVQTLPNENVFQGLRVSASDNNKEWLWGGGMFSISKDVIEKIVANKHLLRNDIMEDMSLSYLVSELGVPFIDGKSCSIDKTDKGWRCIMYGYGNSFEFTEWEEIKNITQHYYRVKNDLNRDVDRFVMERLFEVLN